MSVAVTPVASNLEALVDLARYPVHRLAEPEGATLVDTCRRQFVATGVCLLPEFLTSAAIERMVNEAGTALAGTFYCHDTHNAYLRPDDPAYGPDHPRNRRLRTDVGSIASDLLPRDGALLALYHCKALTRFIGEVLGHPKFYRSADPLGAVSVNVFEPGGGHHWHFDESRFAVTLMLQPAETGGHFEYVTNVRSPDDDGHDPVGRILDGDESRVERLPLRPGTLSIFNGRDTLHRVTEVGGKRHRLVPVLVYATQPGVTNSDAVRVLFWGRTGRESAA